MRGGRVFISYRRDDSRADSGRLNDRLAAHFPDRAFRDVDDIEPGVEWEEEIARVLSQSDACIVVIGKNWLNAKDAAGNRRLDNPHDYVRQEVAAVLKRKMRVFPVLVGGASMPAENELPADLQELCRRNAIELPERYWDEAVQRLIKALETAIAAPPHPPAIKPGPSRNAWLLPAAAILAAALAVGVYFAVRHPGASAGTDPGSASDAGFQFAGDWRAVVMMPGQRTDEQLDAYPDRSFRMVTPNGTTGLGRWQYNTGTGLLEVSDAVNLANGVRYACTWKDAAARPDLTGTCVDRLQNAWQISLTRLPGRGFERSYDVPSVNLSSLTTAEKAAFNEILARQTCGCGMKLLFCLRKHAACPFSRGLAQTALADFLRKARS